MMWYATWLAAVFATTKPLVEKHMTGTFIYILKIKEPQLNEWKGLLWTEMKLRSIAHLALLWAYYHKVQWRIWYLMQGSQVRNIVLIWIHCFWPLYCNNSFVSGIVFNNSCRYSNALVALHVETISLHSWHMSLTRCHVFGAMHESWYT